MARPPQTPFTRLARDVAGTVHTDPASRELYACDASLYRRLPQAVLRAAHADDLAAAVAACAHHGVALTMRGAGTSLAGQSVGTGLVVDATALSGIAVDAGARTATVGPGAVLDQLNAAAAPFGLTFGPDVATASRATLGGMVSNNSAGMRSVVYGLTADHVESLDVVLADGTTATLRRGVAPPAQVAACADLAAAWEGPSLMRRVSGYALDALAGPDPDWPRLVCGSEGTLAVITAATVRLVPVPAHRSLVLMPFGRVEDALAAVADVLTTGPSAIELLDHAMLDPRNRPAAVAHLTAFGDGVGAMLMVEYQGSRDDVEAGLALHAGRDVVRDPAQQRLVWAVRRAGLAHAMSGEGVAHVGPDHKPQAFIEDPAVPPERLPSFARAVRGILDDERIGAVWFGHASVGCLHIRPLMDLRAPGAVDRIRRIAEAVADAVVAHDGSLSGEHGDGRVRSPLLARMYGPATMAAFGRAKALMDPDGILNPGIVVDPEPLEAGLRIAASPALAAHTTALSFAAEGGFARAAEACNGNGACRAASTTMCPSFQALQDERHSTRGRAVLLRAALEGRLDGGLANPQLHQALDLCLACTACRNECPASVDMAALKAEALAHRHRAGGASPTARLAGNAPRLLALGARAPRLARLGARLASRRVGRPLPAPTGVWRPGPDDADPTHVLFADTFTRFIEHDVGDAAIAVLRHGGARVRVSAPGCCGRPLLSQGFIGAARAAVRGVIGALDDGSDEPIVMLEPSCASMLGHDAARLLGDDAAQRRVAARLTDITACADGALPTADGVVSHAHCHDASARAKERLARTVGATDSGAGCCGMAGAFGYLHPDVSRAVAADRLLPALDGARLAVAPGFSCRCQVRDLTGVAAVHPAQALRDALVGGA